MGYYNDIARGYNELHKEEQLKKLRVIAEELKGKIRKTDFLLDVGCGTAFSLDFFDCNRVGIDSAIELLKQSKYFVIDAEAEHLPFKDKSFDFVISVTALHNFDDIGKGLREIRRVCRGVAVLSILNHTKKLDLIKSRIMQLFKLQGIIQEEKDIIYFLT